MEIPYKILVPWPKAESLAYLTAKHAPAIWLDSADTEHPRGKHSYLCLEPRAVWSWQVSGEIVWEEYIDQQKLKPGLKQKSSWEDLENWYQNWSKRVVNQLKNNSFFLGGLMGFIAYEAWSQDLPWTYKKFDSDLPLAQFLVVDTWLHLDHTNQVAHVYSWGMKLGLVEGDTALARRRAESLVEILVEDIPIFVPSSSSLILQPLTNKKTYLLQIEKIQQILQAGDCYQINLAQKFIASAVEDPAGFYLKLRTASPAPQMVFLNLGVTQICSASPEILLQVQGREVCSYPIKGTRLRLPNKIEDQAQQKKLLQSKKDGAELLMIVDLVRNDIGKVAKVGSVKVSNLRNLETFSHVHHLVSTISATLDPAQSSFAALRALFPGGSITGAPKLKAMEWIHRLEDFPRGIYTGSLGYFGFGSVACFNIAIRTAVLKTQRMEYFAGGGITVDSNPELEYQETWDKTQGFLAAVQA